MPWEAAISILYDARWQAFDNAGNPLVGATLTVYNTGGTVLATIWRDAALTIAMTNPTTLTDKSDAAGRFGQVFTAENAIFDVLLKDALGNTVASYVSVVGLGANSGTFVRDFTNSRGSIRGAGGTVYFEAGDPTGDDVGGTMSLGGWLGTQADLITLNAVLVNITGRLKENGKKIPGTIYTEATSFSGATSVVIALPNDPTGVRGWQIDLLDFALTTVDDGLRARFSYDGGATYKSGATDYAYYSTYSGGFNNVTGDAEMALFTTIEHTAVPKGRATLRVFSPLGSDAAIVEATASLYSSAGGLFYFQASAFGLGGYGRPTHIKLFCNTSQMSGIYRVIPERGWGET